MTTLIDILKHLDVIAPRELEIPGQEGYIEVGPFIRKEQSNTTVNRVIVAVYPSAKTIAKASQEKTNLIISFLPMFTRPTKQVTGLDLVRLRLLSKNYISMYIIGSAWISANGGLSDALADALSLAGTKKFMVRVNESHFVPIGRVSQAPSTMNHSGLVNYIVSKLAVPNVLFTGALDDEVDRILVVAGSLVTPSLLVQAVQDDIKTIIAGEARSEDRLKAHAYGLNLLELGAFNTEAPGMKRLRHQLSLEYPELKIDYSETEAITRALRSYSEDMA
jgi:putative NIF3 family GTP cyclohydrolase 1 type 2